MNNNFLQSNKDSWDLRTTVHVGSEFYDVEGFKTGNITLHKPELDLLGPVMGKKLLHLQCHFGLDSMSWARLGAKVTGIDISPKAIAQAKEINSQLGLDVNFIEGDVQQIVPFIEANSFDIVISTYGVLCWLGNILTWSQGIKHSLKPGGRFVLVEFHPMLDVLYNGTVSGFTRYFTDGKPLGEHSTGTYTNRDADIAYLEYRWQHNISEIVNACLKSGLKLKRFEEYPYCPYKLFPDLDVKDTFGNWISTNKTRSIPYLYSLEFVV